MCVLEISEDATLRIEVVWCCVIWAKNSHIQQSFYDNSQKSVGLQRVSSLGPTKQTR